MQCIAQRTLERVSRQSAICGSNKLGNTQRDCVVSTITLRSVAPFRLGKPSRMQAYRMALSASTTDS